jgi:predicted amidohydrolase YtcJ
MCQWCIRSQIADHLTAGFSPDRRQFMAYAASFALATHAPRRTAATEGPADVIFRDGPIHPMSGPGEGRVDALAIGGGTILAAGALDKVMALAGPGTQIVDLGGRTVLPGLIDPHNHTVLTSLFGALMTNVGYARYKTKAEAVAAMKATAAKTAPGAWMTFGF